MRLSIETVSEPRYHDFNLRKSGPSLTLTGEVPSDDIKNSVLAEAHSTFATVIDNLTVSGSQATAGYPLASTRGLAVLEKMERGFVRWEQGVFSASGLVLPEQEESVRNTFGAAADALKLGALELQLAKSAAVCNENFKESLQQSTIQFGTGSATISQASRPLTTAAFRARAAVSRLFNDRGSYG